MAAGVASRFVWDGAISWYPGHMAKATRIITERMKNVDILLEIRDARIPFSSHNSFLEESTRNKERIILFNKADLAEPRAEPKITKHFEGLGKKVMFLKGTADRSKMKKVIPLALSQSKKTNLSKDVLMIVMGIPNCGKSTIINSLRAVSQTKSSKHNTKVAKVGAKPGVTRHMSSFRVSDSPPAFLFDTPGVMLPRIEKSDNEVGLKLALTDTIVDSILLADYLLHCLNVNENYSYLKMFGIPEPTTSIDIALTHIAMKLAAKLKNGEPNIDYAAHHFVEKYRNGELGRMTLDQWKHLESRELEV